MAGVTAPAALVTGATGFIGSHLVGTLVADGWTVRASGRSPRPAWLPAEAEYQPVDLAGDDGSGPTELRRLLDGVSHLFHLAGASSSKSSQEEMQRANVVATQRLLDAAPALDRMLHMSSTSIYGEEVQLPLPVHEDVEAHPSRGYGKAKWATEEVVREHGRGGLPAVILRPVTVYGPGNVKLRASAVLDVAIEHALGLEAVEVAPEPIEQRLVHIDDLVRAAVHLATAEGAVGRAFNVVSESYPSSHEVARTIAKGFGMAVRLSDHADGGGPPYEDRRRAHAEMVSRGMDPSILFTEQRFRFLAKANRNNRVSIDALLGTGFRFRQTDLEASIAHTLEWYRARRWVI